MCSSPGNDVHLKSTRRFGHDVTAIIRKPPFDRGQNGKKDSGVRSGALLWRRQNYLRIDAIILLVCFTDVKSDGLVLPVIQTKTGACVDATAPVEGDFA